MRVFSLLACCLCLGMSTVESFDKMPMKQKSSHVKIHSEKCSARLDNRAFGRAIFLCSNEPFFLKSGDAFTSLEATAVHNMTYSGGEFTIEHEGPYSIHYAADMRATQATSQNSITLGIVVNGEVMQKEEVFATPDVANEEYPFLFSLKKTRAFVDLKKGDKVSLRVVDMSLEEESRVCVICNGEVDMFPVTFSIRSKLQLIPQAE